MTQKELGSKIATTIGDALGASYTGSYVKGKVWVKHNGKPSGYVTVSDDGSSFSTDKLKTSSVAKADQWILEQVQK